MRNIRLGLSLAGLAALLLTACGGGGGGSGSSSGGGNNPPPNVAPTANAGAAQTVDAGVLVTLSGSGADSDGTIASYAWTQTAGPAVVLSNSAVAAPTFMAPNVATSAVLTFSLVVTDNRGAASAASTVNISVNPLAPVNQPPTANAGTAQSVTSGTVVTLDGSTSQDPDGTIASYAWTQTAGTAVTLSSASTAQPTFTAPTVAAATALTFSLVVTDDDGAASSASSVTVTVNPVVTGNVAVSGIIRFANVPISGSGLNYGNASFQPSRGVTVQIRNASTQALIDQGSTDSTGAYSFSVPANTNVFVRTLAQMTRGGTQPLPRWNVEVRNGVSGNVYSHDSATFSSGAGITQNVDIPLGINASGTATGTRASGPFAILNTIYTAMQTILAVAPTTDFPSLIVAWGPQSTGTFFSGGTTQYIELLAALGSDTDEFDKHVVAHEYGHYIEHNFSRSDSIGGQHSVGNRLDPRVAFGEGFGYAFAAIVLGDPVAWDSFINNGVPDASGFNIETNPPSSGSNSGCWCSESSVWAILYDVFDANNETGDTVSLGFGPIWNVLTGAQANTPAFTSIFSFMTALKAQVPAGAIPGIDTLLSAQNMVTNMDAFGTTETTLPATPVLPSAAVFPLYTTINNTGSVTLSTVDNAGWYNKLGNRRYVRFVNSAQRTVTITLTTSNPDPNADPDFRVWRAGQFIRSGEDAPPGAEVETINNLPAGTYLIDLYDCANGCSTEQGTPGDYDLTLTIN